jgi:hypothetical protein
MHQAVSWSVCAEEVGVAWAVVEVVVGAVVGATVGLTGSAVGVSAATNGAAWAFRAALQVDVNSTGRTITAKKMSFTVLLANIFSSLGSLAEF